MNRWCGMNGKSRGQREKERITHTWVRVLVKIWCLYNLELVGCVLVIVINVSNYDADTYQNTPQNPFLLFIPLYMQWLSYIGYYSISRCKRLIFFIYIHLLKYKYRL